MLLRQNEEEGQKSENELQGFRVKWGQSCVIGLFGRKGPAAILRQHCPQMTRRRCKKKEHFHFDGPIDFRENVPPSRDLLFSAVR